MQLAFCLDRLEPLDLGGLMLPSAEVTSDGDDPARLVRPQYHNQSAQGGIGGWSKDDLAQYLKTGTNNWTLASGPMAEAVSHSTSQMTDEDITAISTYLKDSGNSASRPTPVAANDNAMRAGAAIYKDSCAVCHRDSGEGESHLFPRLAGSALVQSDDPTWSCRGRGRWRPPPGRPRLRCRRLTGD
jgi:mono/diheme cytochrome c family protein